MISVQNVRMRLKSGGLEIEILRDVSLEVPSGQICAVVGPSGSGKSTLLGLIAGLDTPTAGRIFLDGTEITRLSEDEMARVRRRKVGYIFQSFHLIPTLRSEERRVGKECRL